MFTHQKKHPELLALSCISALIVLSLQRWIEGTVSLFSNANGLPLAVGLIGLAIGMTRNSSHTKHISFAFLGMSCLLHLLNLIVNSHTPMPLLEPIADLSALIFGPFLFSFCVGARFKQLFNTEDFRCWAAIACGFLWGFLLFVLSTVYGCCPALQLAAAALLLIPLTVKFWRPANLHIVCLVVSLLVFIFTWKVETMKNVSWSMYHRFHLLTSNQKGVVGKDSIPSSKNAVLACIDRTLQDFYSPMEATPALAQPTDLPVSNDIFKNRTTFSKLFYLGKKPSYVLVLGSGLGEDVSQALKAGASYIDAVEIDPVLLGFGETINTSYASPLVHIVNEDPRTYLNNCNKKYDAVVLRSLDLQDNAYTLSHLRDVSLYTKNSYRKCLNLLNPNGSLLLSCAASNSMDANQLCQRFYATTNQALTAKPEIIGGSDSGWTPFLFRLNKSPLKPPALSEISPFNNVIFRPEAKYPVLTDDLPYICLRNAPFAMTCFAFFILTVTAISFATANPAISLENPGKNRQFLLVATGLVLVVTGTINRCELLLGTSWYVSAIAYGAILLLNWLMIRARIDTETGRFELFIYPTLLASLLVSFLLPIHWLSKWGVLGLSVIILLTVLPIFRILLIVPTISAHSKSLQKALVFHLLGLAMGILLQPAAIYLGNNSLFLLALVAFAIAMYLDIKFGNKPDKVENKLTIKRIA